MSESSLRDTLTSAFDEIESDPVVPVNIEPVVQVDNAESAESRARDEAGRFAPKSVEQGKDEVKAAPMAAEVAPVVTPEPIKPPQSWKKDYWDAYQKLDPKVAAYINEREQQFATGVSTYKQEAERAKEIYEAIAPFQQDLQAHNLAPAQWIQQLGGAHQILVRGTPEQKLQAFQRLAHEYGVPLQNVISGQIDPVMQYLSPLQEQVRQLQGDLTGWKEQQQKQEQAVIQSEIQKFSESNPYFDQVKDTMAGLLQSGMASDLQSAYDKAVRLNDEVFAQAQQAKQDEAEKHRRETEAAKVNKARANTVSPRTATPAGVVSSGGKKDLRSTLEEAVESVLGGARV
jgi:hypothetical protein